MLEGSGRSGGSSEQSSEQGDHARNQFAGRMERLLLATGAKSEAQLAKILKIKHQSISAARKKMQLPFGWIVEISERYNVSSDWLLYGTGSMRRGGSSEEKVVADRSPEPGFVAPDAEEGRIVKPEGYFYPDLLRIIVTAVEKWLTMEERKMEPGKKAELTVMLYELFREKGEAEVGTIEKYLRLVS